MVNGELVNAGMLPSIAVFGPGPSGSGSWEAVVWACSNSMGMLPASGQSWAFRAVCRADGGGVPAKSQDFVGCSRGVVLRLGRGDVL